MSRALVLVVAWLASACATPNPSRVRDLDGFPLPPYALSDTASPVYKVQCEDGRGYLVVTDVPAYLYVARFSAVYRFAPRNLTDVCHRILASR